MKKSYVATVVVLICLSAVVEISLMRDRDRPDSMIVFGPRTEMLVGGQLVKVTGCDECPRRGLMALSVVDLNPSCIVIDEKRKAVSVSVEFPWAVNQERWTVERNGSVTNFRREDGSLVVPENVPTTK
jgi:hypothetical protein